MGKNKEIKTLKTIGKNQKKKQKKVENQAFFQKSKTQSFFIGYRKTDPWTIYNLSFVWPYLFLYPLRICMA